MCVRGMSDLITLSHKYITSHCPDLVQIPLTHKYMTSNCPDLIPLTHKYMTGYQVRTVRCHVFVLGVSSQGREMSCIFVLRVSVPSQDSEMLCITVPT
jgi:hypothetical protein